MSAISPELLEFIEEALGEIELSHIDPVLGTPMGYTVKSRGKHLRPLVCSLSVELLGASYEGAKNAILALELLHDASLVHDDIIDEDSERRGLPSVHRKYGTKTAVLTGDAMFTLGLRYALKTGNIEIVDILTDTTLKMLQGIALQSYNRGRLLAEENYLKINYMKSGSLFEAAAKIGGIIASGTPSEVSRLAQFGRYYGNAYQILDDICDAVKVDNGRGSDLSRGDLSLPLIYALASKKITVRDRKKLSSVYKGDGNINTIEVLSIYEETGAIEKSSTKMREYAGKARKILDSFTESHVTVALHSMLDLYDTQNIMTTVESDLLHYLK